MSNNCPYFEWAPTPMDTGTATSVASEVGAVARDLTRYASAIDAAVSVLEAEIEAFKFSGEVVTLKPSKTSIPVPPTDWGTKPDKAPQIPDVEAGTYGEVISPGVVEIETQGISLSQIATPAASPDLGTFSPPGAPSTESAVAPSMPSFPPASVPLPATVPALGAFYSAQPPPPGMSFDVSLTPLKPLELGTLGELSADAELMPTESPTEYEPVIIGQAMLAVGALLEGKLDVQLEVLIPDPYTPASSLWSRMGWESPSDTAGANHARRMHNYQSVLTAARDTELWQLLVAVGLNKAQTAYTIVLDIKLAELSARIAVAEAQLDAATANSSLAQAESRRMIAAAGLEVEKGMAAYVGVSAKAAAFKAQVSTNAAVVDVNESLAQLTSATAEIAGAAVQVDSASVDAARAILQAERAVNEGLETEKLSAEISALTYSAEVLEWKAQLKKATAETEVARTRLRQVAVKNQTIATRVEASSVENNAKVIVAKQLAADAERLAATHKVSAATATAELAGQGFKNITALSTGYREMVARQATAIREQVANDSVATANEIIAVGNRTTVSMSEAANSAVRAAATSYASSATSLTDLAYKYNERLAQAYAAINSGKTAGFRVSASKRVSGDRSVGYSSRFSDSTSSDSSRENSYSCTDQTTYETSV